MRRIVALALGALAALALALPCAARAQSGAPPAVNYTVRDGDTLELLAAEFYGDRRLAVFLMVENDFSHPRPLRPGEKLRFPTAWKYKVVDGDTFATLAERLLGDARRAPFLADFNALPPDAPLVPGQEITIPCHVKHQAAEPEPLSLVAATFYGEAQKAEMLRRYNFRDGDVLARGDVITVPIVHVRVREDKLPPPDPETAKLEQRRREATARAAALLPKARAAWKTGDYAAVKRALADQSLELIAPDVAAETAFLLGSAYVAFGDEDSALAAFRKALARPSSFEVRADRTSPKITRLWTKAGGAVVAR